MFTVIVQVEILKGDLSLKLIFKVTSSFVIKLFCNYVIRLVCLSRGMSKFVFRVSYEVRHKPDCKFTKLTLITDLGLGREGLVFAVDYL